jgi:hypothetical protein
VVEGCNTQVKEGGGGEKTEPKAAERKNKTYEQEIVMVEWLKW